MADQENNTDLDMLSDEEREALGFELSAEQGGPVPVDGDDDDDADEAESTEAAGEGRGEKETASDEADGGSSDEADGADEAAAGAQETAGAETVVDEAVTHQEPPAAAQVPPAVPELAAYRLPDDYGDRLKAVQEKQDALDKELESGELTAAEFSKRARELTREQLQLDALQMRADMAKEMQEQAVQAAQQREKAEWEAEFAVLAGKVKDEADYAGDQALGQALANQVNTLLAARGIDPSKPVVNKAELFRDAHRVLVFLRTGKIVADEKPAPPATDPESSKQAKAEVVKKRKVDLSKAPPTIGTVPAADNGTDGGEFASLGSLDGEKLEAALAKLARTDPAAYQRYLEAEV